MVQIDPTESMAVLNRLRRAHGQRECLADGGGSPEGVRSMGKLFLSFG
ncbi:MAG TPA: hypothetical protein VHM65_10655 [Candidatus Lustribacter sp.]|nr:hypothetical protein [Candidatus Lustribacter sp.]